VSRQLFRVASSARFRRSSYSSTSAAVYSRRLSLSTHFEDVPLVVELRDGGPGVMVRRW
jgi:hypothetical protein